MKLSRISAFVTAIILTVTLCSCQPLERQTRYRDKEKEFIIGQSYASQGHDRPYDVNDVNYDDMDKCAEKLLSDIQEKCSDDEINTDITDLIDIYNQIYEANTYAEINSCKNDNDLDFQIKENETYLELQAADEIISYTFSCGYNSEYKELFREYVNQSMLDKYPENNLKIKDIRANSKKELDRDYKFVEKYNNILNDNSLEANDKDLKCAELLIEKLKCHGADKLYSRFNRDYTGEDVVRVSNAVKEYLIPAYDELSLTYLTTFEHRNNKSYTIEKPFSVIQEYAPRISEQLGRSADILIKKNCFDISDSSDSIECYFTDILPLEKSAAIFIGNPDKNTDLLSLAICTFGIFNRALINDTPPFLQKNNIDIEETCELGLTPFFFRFYDDIYGDMGKYEQLSMEYNMLVSVISGFLIGEFEYTVAKDVENITPEQVVERFNKLFEDFDYTYRLSNINHLFVAPGYYVSYGTSGLVAFDLYNDIYNLHDQQKAYEKYEKLSKISGSSDYSTFCTALKGAGFSDIMSEDFIKHVADMVYKIDKEYNK